MEVAQNAWFIMENPNLKWMMNRGTPIFGTPPDVQGFQQGWSGKMSPLRGQKPS